MIPLYDTNPHRRTPWLTLAIIAANVIVTFLMAGKTELERFKILTKWGFVPKRIAQLSDPKLVVKVDPLRGQRLPDLDPQEAAKFVVELKSNPSQIYASLLTMMFLHGGWWHLISNMWFLWIFGNNIEDQLGHLIYLCFYVLGGLFALACHWMTDPGSTMPVVGASGAVAAVLGAYAVKFPTAKVRTLVFLGIILLLDLPALLVLGFWFLQQLLAGIDVLGRAVNGGVAWWAHVGGFAAGLVLMPVLALGAPPLGEDWDSEANRQFGPPPE